MRNKRSEPLAINQYVMDTVRKRNLESVGQLVKLVQLRFSITEREAIEHILNLQNRGKLTLKNRSVPPPSALKGYLLSAKATWYWIIVALALATTTLVFTVPENAYPIVYARYLLGFLFVLWLPGYCFIKALFPTKGLDNIERIALSIGMSLALVPITGLLLNYTPWGIRIIPVTLTLLALTIAFATAAITREHQALLHETNPENNVP